MPDRTDGKKPKPTPKNKRVPEGERVIIELKITNSGKKKVLSRLKEGTAQFLGLKPVDELPKGKGKSYLRGAQGTKSYALLLDKPRTIGGATVERLYVPVPGFIKLAEFYAYAKSLGGRGVNGFVSPNGRSYRFKIDTSDDK